MEKTDLTEKLLLEANDIAHMLSIHQKTVYALIKSDETFPKPITFGPRMRRWKLEDVKAWIDSKSSQ